MYRALIVDDDRIILNGLKQHIPWEEYGFCLCAALSDSRKVEEAVIAHDIDLILMDIDMPFLNGLELTRRIHVRKPSIVILLLTAHDEFIYAQDAVKWGVFDYLLKPASNEVIADALKRVRWKIEHDHVVQKLLEKSRPLLYQQFFQALLCGKLSDEEIREQGKLLDIVFTGPLFIVLSIRIHAGPANKTYQDAEALTKHKYNVLTLTEEYFRGNGVYFLDNQFNEIVMILNFHEHSAITLEKMSNNLDQLRHDMEKYLQASITVGVGDIQTGFTGIMKSYQEALRAQEFRSIYGDNQTYFMQDVRFLFEDYMPPGEEMDGALLRQHLPLIRKFDTLRERFLQAGCADEEYLRFCVWNLLLQDQNVQGILSKSAEDAGAALSLLYNCHKTLHDCELLDDMIDEAIICETGLKMISGTTIKTDRQRLVDSAVQYLHEHYMEPGLKQSDVAKSVFVSTAYLSTIFKQVQGTSFVDYLMALRMRQAEKLLRETDKKIYEIAEAVGFVNAQYFSVCFKRVTGHPPSALR